MKKSRKELSPIIDCFRLIDEKHPRLAGRIAEYIYDGSNTDVLSLLESLGESELSEAGVWSPRYYSYNLPKQKEKELSKVDQSFQAIYEGKLLSDIEICRRWGIVRALCMNVAGQSLHHKSSVPDWYAAIFLDMAASSYRGYSNKSVATHYTFSWFKELSEKNDLALSVWFPVLCERIDCYGYLSKFFNTILQGSDLVEIFKIKEYIDAFESLHVTGRITIAESLNSLGSLNDILPFVILLATDSSKQVRDKSKTLFSKLDQVRLSNFMADSFFDYSPSRRKELAHLVSVYGGKESLELLTSFLSDEKSKSVKNLIESIIANKNAAQSDSDRSLAIPKFESVPDDSNFPDEWLDRLREQYNTELERLRRSAEDEKRNNAESKYKSQWRQESYERISKIKEEDLNQALHFLASGRGTFSYGLSGVIKNTKILNEPEFGPHHIVRLMKAESWGDLDLNRGIFQQWLRFHPNVINDLRQLSEVIKQNGLDDRSIANWILRKRWQSDFNLPDTHGLEIWPFFAENDHYIKEAFGLIKGADSRYHEYEIAYAILVLEKFPVIPEQYLQVIYEHALSPAKTYGPLARKALTKYGLVEDRVISALASSKQDERIVAAEWIAELKTEKAVPELKKSLKKEKRETAKAAILSALHALGEDISVYLSPEALLKEAETGLKKAMPKGLSWFPFSTLPDLKWLAGKSVDPKILTWWIVLSTKLKQPEGNPLLDLYLQQLDPISRATWGMFILQVFLAQDTACPSDEEAGEYAKANQQLQFSYWQRYAKSEWGEVYKDKTIEDAYTFLFRSKKSEYLGSAIGEKGILAMISAVRGGDAVQLVNRYMKDHYTRRHQIEAILSALANSNDPVIIQLLLSIARRHRTNSVQEKARTLVEEIAERNGWTQDELADRTIPTAGFEPNGSQVLQLGSRELIVKLSPDLKVVLVNEQGKTLKSLPAARQDDDPEQVKQAKKDFSSSKKELKQVVDLQGKRLYEAMCVEREWEYAEWKEYLLDHPVMRHLVQKLVWKFSDGDKSVWARPTAELELIDIEDEDYNPSSTTKVSVAHASQLSSEEGKAWIKHFKEEKIKPLFGQFEQPTHELSSDDKKSTSLNYHKGWMTDAFTLRGILTKRGYQRGDAEDGGYFTNYYKDFRALGLRVVIEFSGNCLPEENCAAALYCVAFVNCENRAWISEGDYKCLDAIPENLVNEVMLDYEAIAAKSAYDENWEKKVPW
jgi:hypothetical protein